jgi:hypothetical protein
MRMICCICIIASAISYFHYYFPFFDYIGKNWNLFSFPLGCNFWDTNSILTWSPSLLATPGDAHRPAAAGRAEGRKQLLAPLCSAFNVALPHPWFVWFQLYKSDSFSATCSMLLLSCEISGCTFPSSFRCHASRLIIHNSWTHIGEIHLPMLSWIVCCTV